MALTRRCSVPSRKTATCFVSATQSSRKEIDGDPGGCWVKPMPPPITKDDNPGEGFLCLAERDHIQGFPAIWPFESHRCALEIVPASLWNGFFGVEGSNPPKKKPVK